MTLTTTISDYAAQSGAQPPQYMRLAYYDENSSHAHYAVWGLHWLLRAWARHRIWMWRAFGVTYFHYGLQWRYFDAVLFVYWPWLTKFTYRCHLFNRHNPAQNQVFRSVQAALNYYWAYDRELQKIRPPEVLHNR